MCLTRSKQSSRKYSSNNFGCIWYNCTMNNTSASDMPLCVAIIICNEIIEDKTTNNKTLVGLFNSISVSALPAMHPRLFFFASVTHIQGDQPLSFTITSPTGKEILRADGAVSSGGDIGAVIDLTLQVLGLTVGEEGMHSLNVVSGQTVLGSRSFSVLMQK